MIDMHIHTNCSDGSDDVSTVLRKAETLKLDVISITDHNSVQGCKFYRTNPGIYTGKFINGIEITTSYKEKIIEILGYGIDLDCLDSFLKKYFSKEVKRKNEKITYEKLLLNFDKCGIKYDENKFGKKQNETEFLEKRIFENLVTFKENLTGEFKDIFESQDTFFRKGVSNPDSALYIDYSVFFPSFDEVIYNIHKAEGISIVAHPYNYVYDDVIGFLQEFVDVSNVKGVEAYYTRFSEKQTKSLIDFAKRNNLLISGGSDYHGTSRPNRLGVGYGNLNIPKEILNDWGVKI